MVNDIIRCELWTTGPGPEQQAVLNLGRKEHMSFCTDVDNSFARFLWYFNAYSSIQMDRNIYFTAKGKHNIELLFASRRRVIPRLNTFAYLSVVSKNVSVANRWMWVSVPAETHFFLRCFFGRPAEAVRHIVNGLMNNYPGSSQESAVLYWTTRISRSLLKVLCVVFGRLADGHNHKPRYSVSFVESVIT